MSETKSEAADNTTFQTTTTTEIKESKEQVEVIKKFYCKLYLFRDPEWTERGVGDLKFYTNKDGLICMIHNREKTGLISLHQVVSDSSKLSKRDDIKHCYSWTAADNSDNDDGTAEILTFAIRFKTEEIANEFKELFEKSQNDNKEKGKTQKKKEDEDKDDKDKEDVKKDDSTEVKESKESEKDKDDNKGEVSKEKENKV